ncbi:radical SAM protein [Bradyrhizobium sp. ISRA464]|uniref:radical SAM protein n=2 Tax=unclassified Bradyrhizobium TaxID=2631580 RepID=UPI002479BB9D|nr:radical SAM protein [Bradyrhizobium sp. ISRA464]WGS29063.1 radical SAM protein [Bradyrhizobium sp. ISRA464]
MDTKSPAASGREVALDGPDGRRRADSDYVFHELTRSICPSCKAVIDAKILFRDNKVYMSKRCPQCGTFMSLVYDDAQAYVSFARYNKPGTIPLAYGTSRDRGCPHDCGLCPDHEQHACLGIVEVNSACDMDCPLCFADAAPGFSLSMEEVEQMLDDYVRTEGRPEVVQFSGGEPTMHPRIIDFVRAAHARDIRFVMINTNGKRIARDDGFLKQLEQVRPSLYFQFDGFERETYRVIRGEPDLLEEKLFALDRLAEIGLDVTIVPAIERGVNEHEIGRIVEFAIEHPAVRGITFQPAFHAGRHFSHDPMKRMTIPEIVRLIEQQTGGKFVASDFVPVPCCFPTCNSVTYAFIEGDKVTPLPRIVDVGDYLDYITNRIVPDFSREVRAALEGLWSSSSVAGSDAAQRQVAISCQACELPDGLAIKSIAKNMIMIMLQDFMDPWTFNQKNLMKCCKEFLLPGGKQIPFCAYNSVGYREQAREQLNAMEPERRQAWREGRPYEPKPVIFEFGDRRAR